MRVNTSKEIVGIILLFTTSFVIPDSVSSLHHKEDDDHTDTEDVMEINSMKMSLIKNVDKIVRKKQFQLIDGITLEQIPGTERLSSGRALTDKEIQKKLPADPADQEDVLDSLLEDRIARLLNSHSLQMSLGSFFPGASIKVVKNPDEKRSIKVGFVTPDGGRGLKEARGKLKKILPLLLIFKYKAAMGFAVALAAIAALAGKALLVAKLALLLAGIIGLKKLAHHGGEDHASYSYVSYPSHGGGGGSGGGYGRDMETQSTDTQQTAYRGQS